MIIEYNIPFLCFSKVNNDEYVKNFNKILTEDEEEKIEPEKDREKKKHKSEVRLVLHRQVKGGGGGAYVLITR